MFTRQRFVIAGWFIIGSLLVTACGQRVAAARDEADETPASGENTASDTVSPHSRIDGLESIIQALEEAGAAVEAAESIEQPS